MDDDVEPRKRGRPRAVEDPIRVSVRVSSQTYDGLDAHALRLGITVPELIRRELAARLKAGVFGATK